MLVYSVLSFSLQLFRQRASSTWCWNFSEVEIYLPDYQKRLVHSRHDLVYSILAACEQSAYKVYGTSSANWDVNRT